MVNYTNKSKAYAVHNDNYVQDVNKSPNRTNCYNCIFVGENKAKSKQLLCAKHQSEIAEVEPNGTCDSGKAWFFYYNGISRIRKSIMKLSGFKFKNR